MQFSEDVIIRVDHVSKTYRQGEKWVTAINDISFDVKKGELFSIVGRSGSGKTTLLNLLGVMSIPSTGRIAINGKTLDLMKEKELVDIRRFDIATIYQNYNLIPVLSALQNIELPMNLVGINKDKRQERAKKLLEIVGLSSRANHKPDELSGGEQQRVSIARALANQPKIILADEPTADLDPEIGKEIISLLEGINRDLKTTIVMITHDIDLACRADRMMSMRDGHFLGIEPGSLKEERLKSLESREVHSAEFY